MYDIPDTSGTSGQIDVEAFNRRKEADLRRRRAPAEIERREPFHVRLEEYSNGSSDAEADTGSDDYSDHGEEGWKNSEGERLRDFGVDEEAEFYDEEDIPLALLIQQRAKRQHLSQ